MSDWPHAPPHRDFVPGTAYMVTAGTYQKICHFRTKKRLKNLQHLLLTTLQDAGWRVQAWAVFANHYHVVAVAPPVEGSLSNTLGKVHMLAAAEINGEDEEPQRRVWFQYREKALKLPRGYYARLRYVHQNAVHHGLVAVASQYPWCSAGWLEQQGAPAYQKMLASFRTDRLEVPDDFDVPPVADT